MKKILKTSLWVFFAIFFLMAGGSKLLNPDAHVEKFLNWGYPLWFLYVTGIIEVGGAIGLVCPAARFYSTLILSATMVGATVTHLKAGELEAVSVTLFLLVFLIVLTWTLRSSKFPSSNSVT
ncbi:MAG: DoxX family protein [Nitrospirota bacterium]|nr:MAG: DoxX family protein [Nitrospirota bacterium]